MSVLEEHPWQTLNGDKVEDIWDKIKEYCSTGKYTLHIGSDTKPYRDSTTLITTICFREQNKGAVVFYQKQKIKFFTNTSLQHLFTLNLKGYNLRIILH